MRFNISSRFSFIYGLLRIFHRASEITRNPISFYCILAEHEIETENRLLMSQNVLSFLWLRSYDFWFSPKEIISTNLRASSCVLSDCKRGRTSSGKYRSRVVYLLQRKTKGWGLLISQHRSFRAIKKLETQSNTNLSLGPKSFIVNIHYQH